jgi:hypothetical protein
MKKNVPDVLNPNLNLNPKKKGKKRKRKSKFSDRYSIRTPQKILVYI